ncbi:MAG: radical SAM family RiPP maturation amino acid epimerase [Acidobacteria bacterium]|nr:radical SAM family RiPP maturation amino acid epimerase [Acidobacteriota bacterium]
MVGTADDGSPGAQLGPRPEGAARLDDRTAATCAHLKRFFELVEGDPDFRARLIDEQVPRAQVLADAGIALPIEEMASFWKIPLVLRLPRSEQESWHREFEQSDLAKLWAWWRQGDAARHGTARPRAVPVDPRARRWRDRHLSRVRSHALAAEDLSHFPLLSFELSQGCSVQCWFCALDPEKLKSYFAYTPENQQLWREVLRHSWELFGEGCQSTICYHGTDPTDNPDFFSFQDDVIETYGVLPQVTTAQPLRDVEWTRTLLRYQQQHPPSHHRFSVLTLGMLRRIHRTFTPEELLDVTLVMQHKEALNRKVECGRAAARPDRLEAESQYRATAHIPEPGDAQTTCECTCGYLVNMVTGRIQLISPATPSPSAPLGYATHAEGTFRTGGEFRAFLEQTVADHMRERLAPNATVRLWDDVQYERLPDGFRLASRYRAQTVRGGAHFGLLGDLLHDGTRTTADITDELIQAGMPVLDAVAWLDKVYQTGVIAEP